MIMVHVDLVIMHVKVLEALPNIEVYYPQTAEEVDIKKFLYSNKPSYINLRR